MRTPKVFSLGQQQRRPYIKFITTGNIDSKQLEKSKEMSVY